MTEAQKAWEAIVNAPATRLVDLFKAEPDRLSRLAIDESGILFDF